MKSFRGALFFAVLLIGSCTTPPNYSALLDTYFDSADEQVISAQLTIGEIRDDVFAASAPDISTSLRLLRQFRTLRETTE